MLNLVIQGLKLTIVRYSVTCRVCQTNCSCFKIFNF